MSTQREPRRRGPAPRRRSEVEELIREYSRGGRSLRDLASEAGIPLSTVQYWRKRLGTASSVSRRKPARFVPVSIAGSTIPSDQIEIDLRNGRRIRVSLMVDPRRLSSLLDMIDQG